MIGPERVAEWRRELAEKLDKHGPADCVAALTTLADSVDPSSVSGAEQAIEQANGIDPHLALVLRAHFQCLVMENLQEPGYLEYAERASDLQCSAAIYIVEQEWPSRYGIDPRGIWKALSLDVWPADAPGETDRLSEWIPYLRTIFRVAGAGAAGKEAIDEERSACDVLLESLQRESKLSGDETRSLRQLADRNPVVALWTPDQANVLVRHLEVRRRFLEAVQSTVMKVQGQLGVKALTDDRRPKVDRGRLLINVLVNRIYRCLWEHIPAERSSPLRYCADAEKAMEDGLLAEHSQECELCGGSEREGGQVHYNQRALQEVVRLLKLLLPPHLHAEITVKKAKQAIRHR